MRPPPYLCSHSVLQQSKIQTQNPLHGSEMQCVSSISCLPPDMGHSVPLSNNNHRIEIRGERITHSHHQRAMGFPENVAAKVVLGNSGQLERNAVPFNSKMMPYTMDYSKSLPARKKRTSMQFSNDARVLERDGVPMRRRSFGYNAYAAPNSRSYPPIQQHEHDFKAQVPQCLGLSAHKPLPISTAHIPTPPSFNGMPVMMYPQNQRTVRDRVGSAHVRSGTSESEGPVSEGEKDFSFSECMATTRLSDGDSKMPVESHPLVSAGQFRVPETTGSSLPASPISQRKSSAPYLMNKFTMKNSTSYLDLDTHTPQSSKYDVHDQSKGSTLWVGGLKADFNLHILTAAFAPYEPLAISGGVTLSPVGLARAYAIVK